MDLSNKLFIGFTVKDDFREMLTLVPKEIVSLFIQRDSDYLQRFSSGGVDYLGKQLEEITSMESLELIQQNVYSLLRRLVADYPYESESLVILSINDSADDKSRE